MKMKRVIASSLATALTLGVGRGADTTNSPPNAKTVISDAEQMKALRKEADSAEAAYMKAIENRQPDAEIEKLWNAYTLIDKTNLSKVFELAKQEPASEPAFETFAWIVTNRLTQGVGARFQGPANNRISPR